MAGFTVQLKGFDALDRYLSRIVKRAQKAPRRSILLTRDRLAVIHQHGGTQTVTPEMQRAIARKIGPGEKPPAVGKVLIHPSRPVRPTPAMLRRASKGLARHILRGGPRTTGQIMREEVSAQYGAGGTPSWRPSRNWGRIQARRPTLGGAGGRVHAGWRAASYREVR